MQKRPDIDLGPTPHCQKNRLQKSNIVKRAEFTTRNFWMKSIESMGNLWITIFIGASHEITSDDKKERSVQNRIVTQIAYIGLHDQIGQGLELATS